MHNPDTEQKPALRTRMLALRHAIPPQQRLQAAQAIAYHFADHPILAYAASFAGYYPIRGEVDILPVFNRMARFDKRTALPALHADSILFREWKPGTPLIPGAHGTREPVPDAAVFIPAIVLTPLLAFDAQGTRLGYGGGYYDRTIHTLRALPQPPLFFGVAFAAQEVERLPRDPHDARLDGILTEEGVSVFK